MKSRTSKVCSEALKNVFSTSKQRNAPKIGATKKFHKNIWADQGREIAGELKKFRNETCMEIYSTGSETKSAVAERYIRTMKHIIFFIF